MYKLADAYFRKGQDANGRNWIRRAWVEGNFTLDRVSVIAARYGSHLGADDHQRRASRLVWNSEYSQANAMSNWIGRDFAQMLQARVKLRQNARDADAAFARVPSGLKDDPGLLFDRARWLRKRDRDDEARPLLIAASVSMNGTPPDPDDWWRERQYQAREALDVGNVRQAYQIASGHDLTKDSGLPFAEAEFLAGWISLQFLNKPDAAFDHFLRLRTAVSAPISVARAHYWAGRAADKAGRTADARTHYEAAAAYPVTFYGQLAATAVNPRGNLNLPITRAAAATPTKQAFLDHSLMQAMQALADIGAQGLLRTFALSSADVFTERDQYVLLSNFLRQLNEPALALRVAKKGLQKNVPIYDIAYPTVSLPVYRGNNTAPESALVMGLTRQESEFDPEAMSSAGARGLMQMMPATAKLTARQHGLKFGNKSELFTPSVNLQLGMAHVSDLLSSFAGSYVLSIASYNAGAGRANQWISRYGDPRDANADVVDWIERIPFNETRNYVQRVLENTQVYRNILAGRDAPLTITQDLKRGGYSAVASTVPQFSSSPEPAQTPPPAGLAQPAAPAETAPAGVSPVIAPTDAQFSSGVVASTPVYDDPVDEPVAKPAKKSKKKKATSKKKTKKKRSSSATASNTAGSGR
jgi:soluble lytic murein transglycosylase